ncbi:hypothetical protein CK203_087375 [Vitis vinifera]|uniref:Reverse transcriptase/retrotransposon-derived protein RNase H-like domain-containing protein n=1 Tax=Vitis vinifera TaxID=29760 RepID=A0A438D2X1_VITVI|nr:hypothetical protein CK203_087375 [Vitis vinifera]
MPAPSNKKELQCLRSPNYIGTFHSPFHGQTKTFFPHTKGASAIGWTDECGWAFDEVKHYLTQPPILSSPQSDEQLYMYLAMSHYAGSAVLFRHVRDKERRLVYYVSKAMVDVETQYSKLEQTSLALKNAAQKFHPYFQAHQAYFTVPNQGATRASYSAQLPASNNKAKYEAILTELEFAHSLAVLKLKICSNFQLVMGKIQKEYEAKDECMVRYLTLVQDSLAKLGSCAAAQFTSMAHRHLCLRQFVVLKYAPIPYMPFDPQFAHEPLAVHAMGNGYSWPLIVASMQKKFLLVDTDYFSKWVEVEAYASIKDKDIYNGPQFDSIAFRTFYSELKIRIYIARPTILKAYRTTPGRPIRTIPFALLMGWKPSFQLRIDMFITKTAVQGQMNENQELKRHLDWVDEVRGNTTIQMASYQQRTIDHYNKKPGNACSKLESWSLEESLRTRSREEPRNCRKIGKDPMS